MSINYLLLGAVVAYILVVVIVGAISSKRHPAKDTKDMLIAGGQLGPLVASYSLYVNTELCSGIPLCSC